MRIRILYVPGCPNFRPAVEQVERVLSSESFGSRKSGRQPFEPTPRQISRGIRALHGSHQRRGCRTISHGRTQPSRCCMKIGATLPPEQLLRTAILGAKRGSEESHASCRTRHTCGSSGRRAHPL